MLHQTKGLSSVLVNGNRVDPSLCMVVRTSKARVVGGSLLRHKEARGLLRSVASSERGSSDCGSQEWRTILGAPASSRRVRLLDTPRNQAACLHLLTGGSSAEGSFSLVAGAPFGLRVLLLGPQSGQLQGPAALLSLGLLEQQEALLPRPPSVALPGGCSRLQSWAPGAEQVDFWEGVGPVALTP